jgi:AAA+ ATPase superfamily predicted ATPase
MAKTVIGREKEKEKLTEALKSQRSELIAVHGRRRIGKTHLIDVFFQDKMIFTITGLQNRPLKEQLENFSTSLMEYTYEFRNEKPKTWIEAFGLLKQYLKRMKETDEKKVIFIDEFPWIDSHKSGFLAAFENFWNATCSKRTDLIVVVCGSAASYIVKNIIENTGGLYHRVTKKLKMHPFNLKETDEFLKYKGVKMVPKEIFKIYMTFGGVAEYLEQIQKGDSSVTVINRLCFEKDCHLDREYKVIFKSLFKDGSYHDRVVNTLAEHKKKGLSRNELMEKMGIKSSGRFTSVLDELIESGFIQQYESNVESSSTTLYKIYDEFCLFHLQFMKKHKGKEWTTLFKEQDYKIWCGYAFEVICLKHVEEIKRALKCDQVPSKNYKWNNDKAQIDLVIEREDSTANLCEIKFYDEEYSIDAGYLKSLENKEAQYRNDLGAKMNLPTNFITAYGVKENQYYNAIVTDQVTMESFFK